MTSELLLWPRSEPFTVGTIPLRPSPKLFQYLPRIVSYAKTKEEQRFPSVSFCTWRHIVCNKIQLSEQIAWLYFENYRLVHLEKPQELVVSDLKLSQCKNMEEALIVQANLGVHVGQLVLLIFLQCIHKTVWKSFASAFQSAWPRNGDLKEGKKQKVLTEDKILVFVRENLEEFIKLSEPDDGMVEEAGISWEAIEALDLIIQGSANGGLTVKPLTQLATMDGVAMKTGYLPITRSFNFKKLISWLRVHLSRNPHGMHACLSVGETLMWLPAEVWKDSPDKKEKAITKSLISPNGRKMIILMHIKNQTLARAASEIQGAILKISQCNSSYLYLLSHLRQVTIEHCQDTIIILGPVATTLDIVACRNTKVIAVARRVCIRDCRSSKFYLQTPWKPLLIGSGNHNCWFAPYNTHYPHLEKQMKAVGIGFLPCMWDKVMFLARDTHLEHRELHLIPPEKFSIHIIPFELKGVMRSIPAHLPSAYYSTVKDHEKTASEFLHKLQEAPLTEEQRKQLTSMVLRRFRVWFVKSGHLPEVNSLARYARNFFPYLTQNVY